MRGVVRTQDLNRIGSGAGYGQLGTTSLNLQDLGGIEGSVNEVVTRESLQIFDGQPMMLFYEEVVRELARMEFTLMEKNLQHLARHFGYDPSTEIENTYAVETDIVVTGEIKKLYVTTGRPNWAHLYYSNIKASPAPVVKTNTPTPAVIDPTNYIIDRDAGAIRLVEGGSIANEDEILVDYTATRGVTYGLHVGGKMAKQNFMLRFVYVQRNGGRQETVYNQAYPTTEITQAYNTGAWNLRTMSFNAAADFTQDEGERLRQQFFVDPVS